MAWVRSRATGNLLPFWLGPQLEDVVRSLRPNEPAPASDAGQGRWLAGGSGHSAFLKIAVAGQRQRRREEMIEKASLDNFARKATRRSAT